METFNSYKNAELYINNRQNVVSEIVNAISCFIQKRMTFKHLYLFTILSTTFVYLLFGTIYLLFGHWWTAALDYSYLVIAFFIIRLYYNRNFHIVATIAVYAVSQFYMGLLTYAYGFNAGLWFFNICMIYFSSIVTLDKISNSKLILIALTCVVIFVYLLDTFVWSEGRGYIDRNFIHLVYICSFISSFGIFVFLSSVCSIQDISFIEKTEEELALLLGGDKGAFGLNNKKNFISHLDDLIRTSSMISNTTHFVLIDFNYMFRGNVNKMIIDTIDLHADAIVAQSIKTYFLDTSYISRWNKHQYMFVLFNMTDEHLFSIMQLFLRECKIKLQDGLFVESCSVDYSCACVSFDDFSKLNLKQALYETENILRLSKDYDKDSIFVANYTCEKEC